MQRKATAACLAATLSLGCAANVGDIRDNIALPSGVASPNRLPEPWSPEKPTRPPRFPRVALLIEGASENAHPATFRGSRGTADAERAPVERGLLQRALAAEGMRLPEPPPQLGEAALRFWTQTERAIGRAFVRDDDDPSVLLALYEKMTTDAALKEIVAPLRPPVEMAIARTETLQRVAAPVRALRLAFREARATERMHVYKGVDLLRCHEALAELAQKDSTADELHIHLEKLGRVSLRAIERICTLSYRNEIQNVQFPPTRGGRKLRRLAARTYRRAFPRRHVIKTTLPEGGWTASNNVRRLRVVIGAQLPLVGVESCTMDEIILSQDTDSPERSAALKCCDVVRSTPIACDAIE